jgi:hypothetical protein
MCECQPQAAMFWAFQPALFERYRMSVEFSRRRQRVEDLLSSGWAELRSKADSEITCKIVEQCAITPLRLVVEHERLVVEPTAFADDPDELFYRKFIPFAGDVELWHLSPTDGIEDPVLGQICYLEFVVGVLDTDEGAALRALDGHVEAAGRVIELQSARITHFNKTLPGIVRRELGRRRAVDQSEQ